MEFNLTINVSKIPELFATKSYQPKNEFFTYDPKDYFKLISFINTNSIAKTSIKNKINMNEECNESPRTTRNLQSIESQTHLLFTNTFLSEEQSVKLNDIKSQKNYIENYTYYKITPVKITSQKIFTFKIYNITVNLFCNGLVDGLMKTTENDVILKIFIKKDIKKTYDLSFSDKLKLELYTKIYNITKAIVFQFSPQNLQPSPIYYEHNINIEEMIKKKLNDYIQTFIKFIIKNNYLPDEPNPETFRSVS